MNRIEIFTEHLALKPLGIEHLQTVKEYAMDYENTKYMRFLPFETEEEVFSFLESAEAEWIKESPDYYEFAIFYKNKHIGAVSIYFESDVGELGWIVNKKYWGNGFAYEAAKSLVEYFSANGTKHFSAHCDSENVASYKTMEKLGMTKTDEWGGRRNRGALQDSVPYFATASESSDSGVGAKAILQQSEKSQ